MALAEKQRVVILIAVTLQCKHQGAAVKMSTAVAHKSHYMSTATFHEGEKVRGEIIVSVPAVVTFTHKTAERTFF